MGFTVDYDKSADIYTAKDAEGNEITVFFMEDEEDGNTMDITLDAPKSKDDSKAQDPTDGQQTQNRRTSSSRRIRSNRNSSRSRTSKASNPTHRRSVLTSKASMDSYEQFFDQYVEFMKKYKDSGDSISMLADYTKMHAIHRHHEQVECD